MRQDRGPLGASRRHDRALLCGRTRQLVGAAALTLALAGLTSCGGSASTAAKPASAEHGDPPTAQALLRIARQFNNDYADDNDSAVYDRWDTQSRKIISAAEYIRRHRECPTAPGQAIVRNAVPAGQWWLVHYSIAGTDLTDYWRYEHGRWAFDLFRSNPQAVRLYRLPAAQYFKAVGCSTHP